MYVLLALSICFASLNSAVLHKAKISGKGVVWRYNLLSAIIWCAVLFFACGCTLPKNADAWIWGAIYGVTQALFILFKTEAMNSGPVAVTTLFGNSSLIVSIAACYFIWKEPVLIADGVGVACLLVGMFLISHKKSGGRYGKKWPLYVFFFLVFASAVGVVFKAFSKGSTADARQMMLAAAIVMLAFYSAASVFTSKGKIAPLCEGRGFILLALLSGLLSCLYNYFNVFLSGALDAVIFFPIFNGGVIILSTVLSVLFLRERLTVKQILGILACVCGICIIGIL